MLAIISAITSAWMTSNRIEQVFIEEGLNTTKLLAEHSLLAVLYGSGENVAETVKTILEYPDIKHVLIENKDHKVILDEGLGSNFLLNMREQVAHNSKASVLQQNSDNWYFIAPILLSDSGDLLPEGEKSGDLVQIYGYAFISRSKETLHNIQFATFINNIAIALVIAIVLVVFVNLAIKYLTEPLIQLAELMHEAEQTGVHNVAKIEGPTETIMIAEAFNKLMDSIDEKDTKLRSQNELLESRVEQRTRDLVIARDTALEASRYKSEILANTTHELRTPLQSIIGYTDVMLEDREEADDQIMIDDLKSIQKNANHLHLLISNILNIAKLETDQVSLNIEEVDVKSIANEACIMLMPLARELGNQLIIDINDSVPNIQTDKDKLLQVLLNLIGNAIKFTENGMITLTTNTTQKYLQIAVADTGIGIETNKLENIFEPFHQVDGSESRSYQGTGLGLAIVQKFIEAMQGKLKVESKIGKGSTFYVYIPL